MKNLLIMALASLLLFSVAAGLSVWLQQSKTSDSPKEKEDDKKKSSKEKPEPAEKEKPKEKSDVPEHVTNKERDAAFEKRQARHEIILADLRAEQAAYEKLTKVYAAESRAALVAAEETEPNPKDPKKPLDPAKKPLPMGPDPAEQKNIDKLAAMYDAMTPEVAAKQFQEMSNNGTMETAVQIMAKMIDKKLAKVLEAMPDQALAGQIVDKIKKMRKATPPIAPGS